MRKWMRWAALAAALGLLALGLRFGLNRDAPISPEGSIASLGLMLLEKERGLYVLAVTQGSPAEKAGFCPGDMLIASQGESAAGIQWLEALLRTGEDSVPLTLRRDGEEMQLNLPVR